MHSDILDIFHLSIDIHLDILRNFLHSKSRFWGMNSLFRPKWMGLYRYIGFEQYPKILEQGMQRKGFRKFLWDTGNQLHSRLFLVLGMNIGYLRNPKL